MTIHIAEPGEERAGDVGGNVRQLSVLRNCLAELIVVGMHLKDAGLFGSYDELRRLISILDRQYLDLEQELDG